MNFYNKKRNKVSKQQRNNKTGVEHASQKKNDINATSHAKYEPWQGVCTG
jgi:hypothetical protein